MERINPKFIFSESGKLYVGGLNWNTSEKNLQRYFSQYGEVIDSVVVKDTKSGRSRGFGFITFADPLIVDTVLQNGPHYLHGRRINPKAYIPKEKKKKKDGNLPKLFLGGLPSNITETDVLRFFGRYGKVTDVVLGFGFLEFEDEEAVERCCTDQFVEFNGKQVEIKRATTSSKIDLAAFAAAPWNQKPMSVGDTATRKSYATEVTPSGIVAGDSDICEELRYSLSETPEPCPSTSHFSCLLVNGDEDDINVKDDSDDEDVKKTDQERKRKEREKKSITPRKVKRQREPSEEDSVEMAKETPGADVNKLIAVLKKKTATYDQFDDSFDVDDFADEFIREIEATGSNLEPLFNFTEEDLYRHEITFPAHRSLIRYTRDEIKKRSLESKKEKPLAFKIFECMNNIIGIVHDDVKTLTDEIEKTRKMSSDMFLRAEMTSSEEIQADGETKN